MSNRKPRLNILAKSLFLRFYPDVNINATKWALGDRLKATLISKEFLSTARIYKIYGLFLFSFGSDRTYRFHIETHDFETSKCDTKYWSFERLKSLSSWLYVDYLGMFFYNFKEDKERENIELIEAYRKVWTELLPDAKIKIRFWNNFQVSPAITVIQELASRLYCLECPANVLIEAPRLDLDNCTLNTVLNIGQLAQVLRTHQTKKLSCVLAKTEKESALFPPHSFDNFPSVPTLRQLKLGCQTKEENIDEVLRGIGPFLSYFPNLDNLLLEFVLVKHPCDPFTLQQITQLVNDSIDSTKALRDELFATRQSLKMEVFLRFRVNTFSTVEEYDEWTRQVNSHEELTDAIPLKSNENCSILDGIVKLTGELCTFGGHYHCVATKWKRRNFVGKLFISIQEWNDQEWVVDKSEEDE